VSGSSESPAGARRRVRLTVRRAREDRGLTQQTVADAMEWSLSKVMRIESGEVTIAPNDLRPLLGYLGIKGKETVDDLLQAAKISKQRKQWWDEPDVRDGFTPALKQVVQLEPDATAVRYFYPLVVPGRLQTPEYARAVFNTFKGEISQQVIAARLAIRRHRRHDLLNRARPATTYVLLDESVLYRRVGGIEVLIGQLKELLELIQQQRIYVRVIPLEDEALVPMLGTYEIIYLEAEDDDDAVLYRESDLLDEIVEDVDAIRRHRATFERLWRSSLDETSSVELIERRVKDLATAPSHSRRGSGSAVSGSDSAGQKES